MKNVLASSQMRTDYTFARDNYTGPILIKASATVVTSFITPFIHYLLQTNQHYHYHYYYFKFLIFFSTVTPDWVGCPQRQLLR